MNRRLVMLSIVTAGLLGYALDDGGTAPAAVAVARRETASPSHIAADRTTEVQSKLAGYGYTVAVDGWYGPQTTRAVTSWQRSNGLVPDGIAGPITQASLGIGEVSEQADRGTVTPIDPPPPPPTRSVEQIIRDVWPDELEGRALQIAYRESRYQPDVTSPTGCCHGVFQLHEIHLSWMAQFGVTSVAQLFDAETNVRMALKLYERDGWKPWAL